MRFLLDENVPCDSAAVLVAHGHDVAHLASAAPGLPDVRILERCAAERRVLVTFDSDFGRLIFHGEPGSEPAMAPVIYLRRLASISTEPGEIVLSLITRSDIIIEGHFTVVAGTLVRQRPLPDRPQ